MECQMSSFVYEKESDRSAGRGWCRPRAHRFRRARLDLHQQHMRMGLDLRPARIVTVIGSLVCSGERPDGEPSPEATGRTHAPRNVRSAPDSGKSSDRLPRVSSACRSATMSPRCPRGTVCDAAIRSEERRQMQDAVSHLPPRLRHIKSRRYGLAVRRKQV